MTHCSGCNKQIGNTNLFPLTFEHGINKNSAIYTGFIER